MIRGATGTDALVLLLVGAAEPAFPLAMADIAVVVIWKGLVCGLLVDERAVCAPLAWRELLLLLLLVLKLLLPDHFLALFGVEEVGDSGGNDANAFAL